MGIVALDTNIFISALNEKSPKNAEACEIIEQIKDRSDQVFISVILLEEFFVRIYKLKQERGIVTNLEFITLGGLCTIVDVNREIALLAAKLRAEYPSLRASDSIHIASAVESGAKIFYTADKRLPKKIGKLEIKSL